MKRSEWNKLGVSNYTVNMLRSTQKELPAINKLVYETSKEELSTYELGGLSDEDIAVQFREQTQFDNLGAYIRARVKHIVAEKQTIEMTGRTLNFIESISDLQAALPEYSADNFLNMSKSELVAALQARYKEEFGDYYGGGSDILGLVEQLKEK